MDDPVALCRESSIAAARQEVAQQLEEGGVNLLINNAGVGLVAPAEFVPLDQWRQVIDVNLQGPLAVSQVGVRGLTGVDSTVHRRPATHRDVGSCWLSRRDLCSAVSLCCGWRDKAEPVSTHKGCTVSTPVLSPPRSGP